MAKSLRELVAPSPELYSRVRSARQLIADMLPLLPEAEACGTDCQGFREIFNSMDQQLQRIEATLFTPPPV